ncbi:MAG: NGG1p interacting factor NIF3 [Elusimicrobiota bacterium]
MKIKDIMGLAVDEGIAVDPRGRDTIERILSENREKYDKLDPGEKEIFDTHVLESPFADSRILNGDPEADISEAWVGIDVDTSELLLVKSIAGKRESFPLVISHHPLGRAYANFYEVMDMQADILESMGVSASVADNLTRNRKAEVARKVSGSNHFRAQDAAKLLGINVMNIHTPADNHVKKYLADLLEKEKPYRIKDLIDILMSIDEYRISAKNGQPPHILTGNESNRCGKIFVDMTGGTEGSSELIEKLVDSGVSTVVGMHMSDKHYNAAKDVNMNVIIAGHISSDNLGLNLLLDKIVSRLGELEIIEFSGFNRVSRNG